MAPAQQNPMTRKELKDGFTTVPGGMHGGLNPILLPASQFHRGINISCRGGFARTRPGWALVATLGVGGRTPFQGATRWRVGDTEYIVAVFNGSVFFYNVGTSNTTRLDGELASGHQVFFTQTDDLLLAGDGVRSLAFTLFDNAPVQVYPTAANDPDRMVPGSIMHFCQGRVHYVPVKLGVGADAAPAYSRYFLSSDYLMPGDPLSVLGIKETQSLDGGFARGLPDEMGPIMGLISAQNPGKGLGLGPLLVFARDGIAAFDVSVPRQSVRAADGTLQQAGWADSPIGSVLGYGTGTQSPWSLTPAGMNVWFRGPDAIYSLMRDDKSAQPGAVEPLLMSFEVDRWIKDEMKLSGISGAYVDKRAYMTAMSDGKDGYAGLLVLDESISTTMGVDAAPAWDGIWTGPYFGQVLEVKYSGVPTLTVVSTDGSIYRLDDRIDNDAGTDIKAQLITRGFFSDSADNSQYYPTTKVQGAHKKLLYADLWLSGISRTTEAELFFRADDYPLWTRMGCAHTCTVVDGSLPQDRRRMRFALRDGNDYCENRRRPGTNSSTVRHGFTFQIKIVLTGSATITRLEVAAEQVTEELPSASIEDADSASFAIIPNDCQLADNDFTQVPPGTGTAGGYVLGRVLTPEVPVVSPPTTSAQKGDKGDKGDQGPRGLTGAPGPTGPAGKDGSVGPVGPPGPMGPQGPAGSGGGSGGGGGGTGDGLPEGSEGQILQYTGGKWAAVDPVPYSVLRDWKVNLTGHTFQTAKWSSLLCIPGDAAANPSSGTTFTDVDVGFGGTLVPGVPAP